MNLENLEKAALALGPNDRATLAEKLLQSLDAPESEQEIAAAWLDEAERRARELDEGTVQAVPAEEVSRKARALLR